MARGTYEAVGQSGALTAGPVTLIYITAPSTAEVEIIDCSVTCTNNSTSQELEFEWGKITTLGTPSATTCTPSPTEQGDQAAASTVKTICTSEPTTYSSTVKYGSEGIASIGAWRFPYSGSGKIIIPPSGTFGLRLKTTTLTSSIFDVRVVFREVG